MFKLIIAGLFIFVASVNVQAETCPSHFANNSIPKLTNLKLSSHGHQLCYEAYSVYTSGLTRTAIWSAERLTPSNLELASRLQREDSFHPEPGIPYEDRAELKNYARSGYDRGHMSPNGDMPTPTAQHESFSLANMIPQNPQNNRGLWAGIESSVREYTKANGSEVYVVSGPAFLADTNNQLEALKGRVLIPTHIWKALYNPATGEAGVYWVANANVHDFETISLAELNKRTGIDVFPNVTESTKQTAMMLPYSGKKFRKRYYEKKLSLDVMPPLLAEMLKFKQGLNRVY
ncbi:MAG: DNA/RNA non-specific endonuclease [Methylophilaceae bacterium]|nr:DNA/RNA non-specific endonuclease [Methylophilaceae bacterium]